MKLSVCMIVKNEERVLDRCLSWVSRIADELIIVDTGSEDGTRDIALKYTPFVYDYKWNGSFCNARNFSYGKATGDYIMWADADDLVDEENILKILRLKEEDFCGADVVYMTYRQYSETGITEYLLRDRVIRRSLNPRWTSDVHETITIYSSYNMIYRSDIVILHKKEHVNEPGRNLKIFEHDIQNGCLFNEHELLNLCSEYTAAGRYEEACSIYRSIRKRLTERDCINGIITASAPFYKLGLFKELIDLIDEAAPEMPGVAQVEYVKGLCMEAMGDIKASEVFYREAVNTPDDPLTMAVIRTGYNDYYPYLRLAGIKEKEGKLTEALGFLTCAGQSYPKEKGWQVMTLHILAHPSWSCSK